MSEQEWVVQPPKQTAQVPDGSYIGTFEDAERLKIGEDDKVRWKYRVKTGGEAGKVASALSDMDINPNALPGRLLSGMLGRPLRHGESVADAINECKGKDYLIVVAPGPKGGKSAVRMASKPPAM